jgi:protein involved in polysaccharide export with SLBB domain
MENTSSRENIVVGKRMHMAIALALAVTFAGCRTPESEPTNGKNLSPPTENQEGQDFQLLSSTDTAQTTESPEQRGKPEAKAAPNEKMKPQGPYRLNVGDVLEISVLDEPSMTREVTIIPDGTLAYLLVGEIPAAGKTISELRDNLTKALSEFFVSPYVSVLTKEINLPQEEVKNVKILGALKNPGIYTWHEGDRLLDALTVAGGLLYTQTELGTRTTANLKASYISRDGKSLDVDFYNLIQLGDMTQNVPIQPNDFIYIASAEESNVIVMGEVEKPRIIPYTRNLNLIEALSICGGFTREAFRSRIVILRTKKDRTKYVEVDVDDLLRGKDIANLTLKGGDIVFVPEQPLSTYSRYAGFLSEIAQLVLDAYSVREAVMFPKLDRGKQP